MSIVVHEGLPGSGKTLRIMSLLEGFLKDGRPVYVFNLKISEKGLLHFNVLAEKHNTGFHVRPDRPNDLHAPLEVDPDTGYVSLKCLGIENGATLVFDEAQEFFKSRGMSKEPTPPLVSMLPTHRHCGYNFHFITQNAMFLDIEIRRLCDSYVKYTRSLNMGYCKLAFYSRITDNPMEQRQTLLQDTRFVYPKHLFGLYVSSVDHNMKVRFPPKLKLLLFLLVFFIPFMGFLVYYLWNSMLSGLHSVGANPTSAIESDQKVSKDRVDSNHLKDSKDSKHSKDLKHSKDSKTSTSSKNLSRGSQSIPSFNGSQVIPLGKGRPAIRGLEGYILTYSGYMGIVDKRPVISMQRVDGDGSCTYMSNDLLKTLSLSIRYGDGFIVLFNMRERFQHVLPMEASPCVNTYVASNQLSNTGYSYSSGVSGFNNNSGASRSSPSFPSSPRSQPNSSSYVKPSGSLVTSPIPRESAPYELPQNPDSR